MGVVNSFTASLRLVIALILLFSLASTSPSQAYEADAGNRAANFTGYDIVSHEMVELDDFLGQWVFVEFWSSW